MQESLGVPRNGPWGKGGPWPIPSSRALGGCLGPRARIPRRRAHCPDGRRLTGEPGMYGLSARARYDGLSKMHGRAALARRIAPETACGPIAQAAEQRPWLN